MPHVTRPRLPPARLADRIVGRALFVWLLLRTVTWVVGVLLHTVTAGFTWADLGLLSIPWRAALWILLVTVALTWLEGRRQRELILLANLGFGAWWFLTLAALPAGALEIVIRLALS